MPESIKSETSIIIKDARDIEYDCDYWITDPPYADAVNYHELTEFFLAWDKKILSEVFPDWYVDSKRILAVRGDEDFSNTMIEIYSNLAKHMPDDGMQVVMFTHSDPAVWAQLAIIMWKAGLKVTAAWNIATETEAVGLKSGNYVKGTVILVLRKQTGDDIAFLDEINADIRNEVKKQIESMQQFFWNNKYAVDLCDFVVEDINRISKRVIIPLEKWRQDSQDEIPAVAVEEPVFRKEFGLWEHQKYFVELAFKEHQKDGGARFLLADQVGLGKTVQLAMSAKLMALYGDKPVLIIVPKTLIFQWQEELHTLLDMPTAVFHIF